MGKEPVPTSGLQKRKFLSLSGFWTPSRPACSKSLYGLRYVGPPTKYTVRYKNVVFCNVNAGDGSGRFIIVFTTARHLSPPSERESSPCPLSYFVKIHFSIMLPSTPRSSKWSLCLRFFNQNPLYASHLPHICHMSCLFNSFLFYYRKKCLVRSKDYEALRYAVFSSLWYLVTLTFHFLPQHPVLKHWQLVFLSECERPSFTSVQNREKSSTLYFSLNMRFSLIRDVAQRRLVGSYGRFGTTCLSCVYIFCMADGMTNDTETNCGSNLNVRYSSRVWGMGNSACDM